MSVSRDREMARAVAEAVAKAGGRTYYVGGLVRDELLGRESKDVDIEVHGLTPEALEGILDGLGARTVMGASFGVYGLKGCDLDIAMPRRERATGRAHRDFAVDVDPFAGTEKAAMRRDFTMNALMKDALTGEIVDHFGGARDLRDGVLRHVNDETFAEDPLRVLRAARFAARFGFRVAGETVALAKTMDLSALPRERVMGELERALLRADRPSAFFEQLREMEQLGDWFPEVAALAGAWGRGMAALDAAAALRDGAEYPLGLMLAALCGEFAGAEAAERFLGRLTGEVRLRRYVRNMMELRDLPGLCAKRGAGREAMAKLYDRSAAPGDLILLAKACGAGEDAERFLRRRLEEYGELMARPHVMGADLVAAGMEPGVAMGEALKYAHELRLAGIDKERALRRTLARARGTKEK